MEGWRQGRLGSKEDHSTTKGNYKTDLTLTGLLMEGLGEARGQSHGMEEGLVATGFVRLRMVSSRFATNTTCAAPRM